MRGYMRGHVRIAMLGALLGAQQLLAPLSVRAQIPDPCSPVPIPGLCQITSPSPAPTDPAPAPGPTPKPDPGGGGGGGGDGHDGDGQTAEGGKDKKQDPKAGEYEFAISGPNSSAKLIAILSELIPYGVPLEKSIMEVVGPFPVAGPAVWSDDWHAPRSGGRLHQGLDIFAPAGTPIVAAADGVISQKATSSMCGLGIEITDASGIQYYHCHLSAFEAGVELGTAVKMGQVIGYIGNTGNAISTPPHVHFEFQPGGIPQPPMPQVDSWVELAERRALALVQSIVGEGPAKRLEFRLTRLFDLAGGGGVAPSPGADLLLLAGMQSAVSSLEVARDAIDQMSWEIDWGGQTADQIQGLVADYEEYLVAQEMLGLTMWPFEQPSAVATADGHD